jgi:hypothetical protein
MRGRFSFPAALFVALSSACAPGRALRVQAEQGTPIVPQHVARRLEPSVGYVLANPVYCFAMAKGGGGDGYAGAILLVLIGGCVGIVSAVDLVALPVQAVRRRGQWRDLELIGRACPLEDPAARVAPALAGRMVEEFGFAPAPPTIPDTANAGADDRPGPRNSVLLRVTTETFERSSEVAWAGKVEFLDPDDQVLWRTECEGKAPARAAATFADECEAARGEVAALANGCVGSITARLRELWPKWKSEPALGVVPGADEDGPGRH